MGFEAYDRTGETYQADVKRLNEIAIHVVHSDHGSFLRSLAEAWLRADSFNKRILMPAWAVIVVKYSLDEEAEG